MTDTLRQLPFYFQLGLLLVAGLTNSLAFAPWSISFIPLITLTLLLVIARELPVKQAALAGFTYGVGWFGAGISWVHVSIAEYGGMPLIASLGLMALLVCYLSIYPALCMGLLARYLPDTKYWFAAFPVLWLATEWLRGTMLTGFPWLSLGYSQLDSPLSAFAPVIGEVGITFILCIAAVLLQQLLATKQRQTSLIGIAGIAVLTAALHLPDWIKPTGEHKQVTLVQGNIEQNLRWQPENDAPTLFKHIKLARPHYHDSDLLIWPEAAIPMLEHLSSQELEYLDQSMELNETALVSGIINYNINSRDIYNALIVLGLKQGDEGRGQYYYQNPNRYYKHHLLPIGEFVPFEDFLRPLAPLFDLPMSSFTRGSARQPNLIANGLHLAPAICYEIIFPRLLRANLTEQTDFILTVSNDAWFGASAGPLQHMQIAQMRALEFGRPVLRATNNGVTAVTDHLGNITDKLPQFEAGVLKSKVAMVEGVTPYQRLGDWPLWIISVLTLALLLYKRRNGQTTQITGEASEG